MEITYRASSQNDLVKIKEFLSSESSDDRGLEKDPFLLAQNGKKIIGCIRVKTLDKNVLELSSLVVDEKYRKKGIGKKLVSEILENDRRRPVYLLTQDALESFYSKNNFKTIQPKQLPKILFEEYNRIIALPFAKNIKVIAMVSY